MRFIFRGRRSISEVHVSLFVAGAVFGEIWNDSRSAKMLYFSIQNARGGRER